MTADTPFRLWEYQTGMTNFRMGLAAWGGSAAAIPADFDTYCVNPWSGAAAAQVGTRDFHRFLASTPSETG